MGRDQERAVSLIEDTIERLKKEKIWSNDKPVIDRYDFIRTWNKTGKSQTLLDNLISVLKSEFVLSTYTRLDYARGYYFDEKKFKQFKENYWGGKHE